MTISQRNYYCRIKLQTQDLYTFPLNLPACTSFNELTEQNVLSYKQKYFKMAIAAARGKLIAVIGDEDTCIGFVLGGVGEMNKNRTSNYMVVDKNTSIGEIDETFRSYTKRDDIGIVLINQNVAEMIRHTIDNHIEPVLAVLEIPSKDSPYDPSKDSILRRAKGMFSAEDFR